MKIRIGIGKDDIFLHLEKIQDFGSNLIIK